MIKLNEFNKTLISSFFEDMEHHTMILSYLQGHMGTGWVDSIEAPKCAKICVGDFSFVAGDYHSKGASSLISNIPYELESPWHLFIPQNVEWGELISECYPEGCYELVRTSMRKDTVFSIEKLEANINKLCSKYQLVRINKELYNLCINNPRFKDLCSGFLSASDFVARGIGFCILHNGVVISGASSYSVYDNGIEIEIDTLEDYRKQGLATICASKLMIECVKKGIYPNWDAANEKSVNLAQKLGYKLAQEYLAYAIKLN